MKKKKAEAGGSKVGKAKADGGALAPPRGMHGAQVQVGDAAAEPAKNRPGTQMLMKMRASGRPGELFLFPE